MRVRDLHQQRERDHFAMTEKKLIK